jgi:uridine kinase
MEILEVINKELKEKKALNIIISGCTCSGKTTLAVKLKESLQKDYMISTIQQDNYYKNLNDIPKNSNGFLTDSINAFECYEFIKDVRQLLTNGGAFVPRYDITANQRISKDIYISKGDINIFEGLHTIKLLKEIKTSLLIFLDVSFETCLQRRIKRDTSLYGIEPNRVKEYFNRCIKPLTEDYVLPQRDVADVIIDERGHVKCLLKS